MLERAQSGRVYLVQRHGFELELDLDDLLDLHQKPGVDLGQRKHLVHAHAQGKSIADVPDALGAGRAQLFFKHFAVLRLLVHAVHADFQAAQGFLKGLLEGATHGHHFANRLHLRRQARISGGKFFKRKTRNLGDDVIDAGFKASRRSAAGDVVAQFVERVADSQFGRDLGDRETRGLGGQGRRTRNAWVHLDHHHAAVHRVDRELHIRATRINADFTQHSQGSIAQDLVFLVSQRLRRCHRDGVAGVHAHGVQVFDRADDDAVVGLVAHDFHLVLFPAEQ